MAVDSKKFLKQIKKLTETQLDHACSEAVDEALLLVERDAVLLCPVDSGYLREKIFIEKTDKRSGVVGNNAEYALYVHEGTSKQKPEPFLVNSLNQNRDEITDIFKKKIQKEVDKTCK